MQSDRTWPLTPGWSKIYHWYPGPGAAGETGAQMPDEEHELWLGCSQLVCAQLILRYFEDSNVPRVTIMERRLKVLDDLRCIEYISLVHRMVKKNLEITIEWCKNMLKLGNPWISIYFHGLYWHSSNSQPILWLSKLPLKTDPGFCFADAMAPLQRPFRVATDCSGMETPWHGSQLRVGHSERHKIREIREQHWWKDVKCYLHSLTVKLV